MEEIIDKKVSILQGKELEFTTIMREFSNPFIRELLFSNPVYCKIILNELFNCLPISKEENPIKQIELEKSKAVTLSVDIFRFMSVNYKFKESNSDFFTFILEVLPTYKAVLLNNHKPRLSSSIVTEIHKAVEQELEASSHEKIILTGYIAWKFGIVGIDDLSIIEEKNITSAFKSKMRELVKDKINYPHTVIHS